MTTINNRIAVTIFFVLVFIISADFASTKQTWAGKAKLTP